MNEPPASVTTWAALLAQWTAFAQASAALPRDADGTRWRASTPSIIGLHAVTLALQNLAELAATERSLAVLRGSAIIDRHEHDLRALWPDLDSADGGTRALRELIADAREALAAASSAKPP